MPTGSFMSLLPVLMQLMLWAYGVIAGMGLTLSYSIRARLNINNTKSDRLVQSGPLPGEENDYFPSTKVRIGTINIVPKEKLDEYDIEIADLKDDLRKPQELTRQKQTHEVKTKNVATFTGGVSKMFDTLNKDGDTILKFLGVDPDEKSSKTKPDTPKGSKKKTPDQKSASTRENEPVPSSGQNHQSGLVVVRSQRRTRPHPRTSGPSV